VVSPVELLLTSVGVVVESTRREPDLAVVRLPPIRRL